MRKGGKQWGAFGGQRGAKELVVHWSSSMPQRPRHRLTEDVPDLLNSQFSLNISRPNLISVFPSLLHTRVRVLGQRLAQGTGVDGKIHLAESALMNMLTRLSFNHPVLLYCGGSVETKFRHMKFSYIKIRMSAEFFMIYIGRAGGSNTKPAD